jgi:hypothetical protein
MHDRGVGLTRGEALPTSREGGESLPEAVGATHGGDVKIVILKARQRLVAAVALEHVAIGVDGEARVASHTGQGGIAPIEEALDEPQVELRR